MHGSAYALDQPTNRCGCGCHYRFQHDLAFSIDHRHHCRCLVDIHPHILVALHYTLLSGSTRSTLMWLLRVLSRQPPDKGRVLSYCDNSPAETSLAGAQTNWYRRYLFVGSTFNRTTSVFSWLASVCFVHVGAPIETAFLVRPRESK